jgi:four helix bundle protein
MDLVESIYRETQKYPAEERYGLTSQMSRCAVSIPSNIAEGQGRRASDLEFARFLGISLGSLCELETQVEVSRRMGFVSDEQSSKLHADMAEIGRMLNGLIRSQRG